MNPVVVVVYGVRREVVDRTFIDIMRRLYTHRVPISYRYNKNRIDIDDHITILFRSGETYKIAGVRCMFYDAWHPEAVRMLSRDGAKEIYIFKFIDELIAVYEAV